MLAKRDEKLINDQPSTNIKSITDFVDLKQSLGTTQTGHVFEDETTHQKFVFKNTKVRPLVGRMVDSKFYEESPGIMAYLDDEDHLIQTKLTNTEIAFEKLAYDLYALCGVNVPKSFIVTSPNPKPIIPTKTYTLSNGWGTETICIETDLKEKHSNLHIFEKMEQSDEKERLSIASEKLPGFKSLDDLIGIDDHSNDQEVNDKRVAFIAKQQINGKPIKGFFESVPVMAFLFDWDGLGHALNNFGFIEKNGHYEFVKIDPGEASLLKAPDGRFIDHFGYENLKEPGSTILSQFSLYPDDRWNFQKIFKLATYEQKLEGVRLVTNLTDKQISDTVHNSDSAKYIQEDIRNNIIKELIRRRDAFKKTYQQDLESSLLVKHSMFSNKADVSVNASLSVASTVESVSASKPISASAAVPTLGTSKQ